MSVSGPLGLTPDIQDHNRVDMPTGGLVEDVSAGHGAPCGYDDRVSAHLCACGRSHPAPRIGHLDERTQSDSPWVQTPIAKPAVVLGSRVGNGFQDLDGTGAAVRQPEGGLLTDPFAVHGDAPPGTYGFFRIKDDCSGLAVLVFGLLGAR